MKGGISTIMNLRDRIGYDAGGTPLEDALAWAVANALRYVDFNADRGPNRLDSWSDERIQAVRDPVCATTSTWACKPLPPSMWRSSHHTSAMPWMPLCGPTSMSPCGWGALARRARRLAVQQRHRCAEGCLLGRLKRTVAYAEQARAHLLLENLNFEPNNTEIHYLAHNVNECRFFFEAISSAHFGWAFTVNHANLVPEGINGFIDAFGISRIGEVRLADNLGDKEVHLNPGEGNIDFASLFTRLESAGYQNHYMMALGNQADKLAARDVFEQYSRTA